MAAKRSYKKSYKSYKKGPRTRSSKALKVRGGFAMPPALSRVGRSLPVMTKLGSDLNRVMKSKSLADANKLMSSINTLNEIYSGKGGVKTSVNPKGSPGFPKGKDVIVNVVNDSTTRMSGANMVQTAKKFKTNIKSGAPSTASVMRCAKNYGTTTSTRYNSERDSTSGARNAMTVDFGFNQKCFWVPTATYTYFTAREYADFWETETAQVPETGSQQVYGLALNQKNTFKISNSNTYFPVKVKAHLVASLDPSVDPLQIRNEVFNTIPGEQLPQAMPDIYQLGQILVNNTQYTIQCDTKANLKQSSFFRNNNVILRTVQKRLAPGDVWELTNDHSFGAGLDLFLVKETSRTGSLNPVGAYWIFELEGIQCEGVDKSTGATYIGTSPGAISWENKKSWSYVNTPAPVVDENGVFTQKAFKVYENSILSGNKKYNVNYIDIGAPSDLTNFYIPVVSDATRTYAQSAVKQDDVDVAQNVVNNYYVMEDGEVPFANAEFTEENEI